MFAWRLTDEIMHASPLMHLSFCSRAFGAGAADLLVSARLFAVESASLLPRPLFHAHTPRPNSEELPYTEEFFLPYSGASRGLTSQDLETQRTMDSDADDDEELPASRGAMAADWGPRTNSISREAWRNSVLL